MFISKSLFLFLSSLILSFQLSAQILEIPFELEENGHIYLKVKVNDSPEVLDFIFDTGATADLLDASVGKKLNLKADYQESIEGAGGSQSYDIVRNQKLSVSNRVQINTRLILSDLSRLNEVSEQKIDGIIGFSILNQFITWIDYEKHKLVLFRKIKNAGVEDYTAIPFRFDRGISIPQFDIAITLNNREQVKGKVLFDSGAGLTLKVNSPFKQKHKLSSKSGKSLLSKTDNLNNTSQSEQVSIKSLTIGGYTLQEMPILLADDKAGVSSYDGYLGILGAEVIKRFHVILDYPSRKLYLKPNKNYENSFNFPLSGIRLREKDDKIIISHVDKSSPAYEKGLREMDELLAIDENNSARLQVYKNLLQREGKEISLKVLKPNGKSKTIKVKLRRLI